MERIVPKKDIMSITTLCRQHLTSDDMKIVECNKIRNFFEQCSKNNICTISFENESFGINRQGLEKVLSKADKSPTFREAILKEAQYSERRFSVKPETENALFEFCTQFAQDAFLKRTINDSKGPATSPQNTSSYQI